VVVVSFWATWWGPSIAMVPRERDLVKRLVGKPFALLGVNSDLADDHAKAKKAAIDEGMTWPSWWDGDVRGPIQTAYDVKAWPTVVVIDREGIIRHWFEGDPGKSLDEAVDTLLDVRPSAKAEAH
jgi:thiol-disulfide isomerase/thioredoxin